MERLTEYSYLAGVRTGDLRRGVDERKAFDCLAAYEDTGLTPVEIMERLNPSNAPLTLEELREMDGEPVWCVDRFGKKRWGIVNWYGDGPDEFECYTTNYGRIPGWTCGVNDEVGWLAYRRKQEDGTA